MKNVFFALIAAAFALPAQAEPNKEIHQEVHLEPVAILSDLSFEVTRDVFDREDFSNSYLWISVNGTYEGNLCGGDRVVLSKTTTSFDRERTEYDVALHTVKLWTDRFELDSSSCAMFSQPTEFTAYVKLEINWWDGGANARTWVYRFHDDRGFAKTLTINLSLADGWRVSH